MISFFTVGAAEAPTQAVETARIASIAARISGYLSRFISAARSVAAAVPALGSIARGVSSAVEWLRNARLVSAEVVGVPGLRILRVESAARDTSGAARTGASATSLEAAAASDAAVAPETALTGEAGAASRLSLRASEDLSTVDPEAEEARGGHTLSRHVGLTDEQLIGRGIAGPRPSRRDEAEADQAVGSNLVANKTGIEAWLQSSSRSAVAPRASDVGVFRSDLRPRSRDVCEPVEGGHCSATHIKWVSYRDVIPGGVIVTDPG